MAWRFFLLLSLVVAVSCDELTVVSSPKALEFRGNSDLESDSLSDVFAASIGYSVIHRTSWDGLVVRDPFNTPNGVVSVVVEGLDKLGYQDGHTYPLSGHSASASIDDFLQSVAEHDNAAIEINMKSIDDEGQQTILGDLVANDEQYTVHYLKPKNHKEDADILKQISYINALAELIASSSDNLPSAIVARMSFDALVAQHSKTSPAIKEAVKLFFKALDNLQTSAEKTYKGSVLVTVIATNGEFIRSKRQAELTPDIINPLNLAIIYSSDYPVIFNIILWFSVILTFSLLAISIAICTMDPGRDSIIYRMTSNRMKKDN